MKQSQLKNFKLQLERLSKKELTESEILALKKAINPAGGLTNDQKLALRSVLAESEYKLTKEHTIKGINYLKNSMFKKNGQIRQINNWPETLENFEINVIKDFKRFLLVGFYNISNNYYDHFVPVYRVYDKKGNYFEYTGVRFDEIEVLETYIKPMELKAV